MLQVFVCAGSTCHMKGSKEIAARLRELVAAHGLRDQVQLVGAFCSGNCQNAVCVTVGDTVYSVSPETAEDFFRQEILPRVG